MPTRPKLVVLQVGENDASKIYVRKKRQACERVGIDFQEFHFPATVAQKVLLEQIRQLNADRSVHGLILQLPVPGHISVPQVMREIDPHKDVDGFCARNLGKVFLSKDFEHLPPATPAGVLRILENAQVDPAGKNVCVVGASNIVGKPIAVMLANRDATVTICNKFTRDLAAHTKMADILIVAAGVPKLIGPEMVRESAVVVDVGINRDENGKLCGDVDFQQVLPRVAKITPVPGGVGPMTVASLIANVVTACQRQRESGS